MRGCVPQAWGSRVINEDSMNGTGTLLIDEVLISKFRFHGRRNTTPNYKLDCFRLKSPTLHDAASHHAGRLVLPQLSVGGQPLTGLRARV